MGTKDESNTIIGPNTGIKLVTTLGIMATLSSVVWWASATTTKLNEIVANQRQYLAVQTEQSSKLSALESRVSLMEQSGSPALRKLQLDLNDLVRQFDVHKATTRP